MHTHKVISNCPVCQNPVIISRLSCSKCNTSIEGRFGYGLFSELNDIERDFVELFVICRGNIKEVEKRLGVSYPTVRAKLDGVVKKLEKSTLRVDPDTLRNRRLEILDSIKRGEISADEGALLLEEL